MQDCSLLFGLVYTWLCLCLFRCAGTLLPLRLPSLDGSPGSFVRYLVSNLWSNRVFVFVVFCLWFANIYHLLTENSAKTNHWNGNDAAWETEVSRTSTLHQPGTPSAILLGTNLSNRLGKFVFFPPILMLKILQKCKICTIILFAVILAF